MNVRSLDARPGFARSLALAATCLLALGCTAENDNSNDNDTDDCPDCDPGEQPVLCKPDPFQFPNGEITDDCAGNDGADEVCPNGSTQQPVTCDNQTADTDGSWDPSASITYDAGKDQYTIDVELWDQILANPDQLLYDDARVSPQNPRYKFVTVSARDFFYEAGFRTNDEIKKINGLNLDTDLECMEAFFTLYDTTNFSVTVDRPGVGDKTLAFIIE